MVLYIWLGVILNLDVSLTQLFKMSLEFSLLLGPMKGVSIAITGYGKYIS